MSAMPLLHIPNAFCGATAPSPERTSLFFGTSPHASRLDWWSQGLFQIFPSKFRVGCSNRSPPKETSDNNTGEEDDDDKGSQVQQEQRSGAKSTAGARNDQGIVVASPLEDFMPPENMAIIAACVVGLFTGISVVLFNSAVHGIRDFCWDGIAYRGASWLREEPIEVIWERVILVPSCGGLFVSLLQMLQTTINSPKERILISPIKSMLKPIFKAVAACVTLGTGNSLGPEGPSVEIGASISEGVGALFDKGSHRKLSLRAAGSAAGISSGFNAAVAGCFFAVESVLWPSSVESSSSLTNTTSMVILSAVIASVVSEIGLGSEPAFIVPEYDFRSPSELPLYLLLGAVCGLVSLTLSRCTSFMLVAVDGVGKAAGIPKAIFPTIGGLAVGLLAIVYPEILYWGFENVDILLESRPSVNGLSVELLLQLVGVKIIATSFCRASGLVGGYYAPSLFVGAATGMAYGKVVGFLISQSNPIFNLPVLEVASPQAYGLVGMAATLAGVCQVPLTAVLLLFELTQDYRIVLPLLGAVGFSSWITSSQTRRRGVQATKRDKDGKYYSSEQPEISSGGVVTTLSPLGAEKAPNEGDLCELESSLCLGDTDDNTNEIAERILVSQAMRTRYVTVLMSTSLAEAVSLMLAEKQSCAIIVNDNSFLIGLLTLADIQQFCEFSKAKIKSPQEIMVSEVCDPDGECGESWAVTPDTSLISAQILMNRHGISHIPVILEHMDDHGGHPVGILDKECINLTCRGIAISECLRWFSRQERLKK